MRGLVGLDYTTYSMMKRCVQLALSVEEEPEASDLYVSLHSIATSIQCPAIKEADSKKEMNTKTFEKLRLATEIINRMTISDKLEYVKTVSGRLTQNMLTTSEGAHAFSTENLLSVALGAKLTDTREEFEAVCGFYRTGYRSSLRDGLYNGRGDIPHSQWRKEIRMLYHNIKNNVDQVPMPAAAT